MREIKDYVAADSPTAARRLLAQLHEQKGTLTHMPNRYAMIRPPFRHLTVGRYVLIYHVQASQVMILRVVHGARDLVGILDHLERDART